MKIFMVMLLPLFCYSQNTPVTELPAPGTNTGVYCGSSTTWNGATWSNGLPAPDKDVIFAGAYTHDTGTLEACSVFVTAGSHVVFAGGTTAIVKHNINVADGCMLEFESSAALVQAENTPNTGQVTIKRKSAKVKKDEFTLWSSPVSGSQSLLDFSPETLPNRFYTYSTIDNIYYTIQDPAATAFAQARGYLIRTGENHPGQATAWEGKFTGIPNTGTVTIPLDYAGEDKAYHAVGNPYPSPISISRFLNANSNTMEGTVWLWRKTQDPAKSSYCTVTRLGYQSNMADNANNPFDIHPEGVINTGQGFIVKAKNAGELVFNNAMRTAVSYDNFFRTEEEGRASQSRMWLNVTAQNVFSQVLIGYTAEGSAGYDNGLDGQSLMDGGVVLYMPLEGRKLSIQARPEFEYADRVALAFRSNVAGTFEFSLDHVDGIFASGQDVFLKDKLTGTVKNLSKGNYSFTTAAGTFEDRFEVVYANEALGIKDMAPASEIAVSRAGSQLRITSPSEIASVTVFDIQGRKVYGQENIASGSFTTAPLIAQRQVLIVQITLENGQSVVKKTMLE